MGFIPDENMTQLDCFKKFLEKKIFQKKRKKKNDSLQYFDIKRIDLCFKLEEIIALKKKLENIEEKIQRMEFDQDIIEKNNKKGIKGDEREYYSYCCFCCETKESLTTLKKEKEESEKKLNYLIELSKENTSEYFCGVAFIIFNTIKEKEEYLSQLKKNCCYSFKDTLIIYLNIFFYFYIPYCCCCCCCFCFCCNYCSNCSAKEKSLEYYKKHIKFERAPEPEDVIFENLETSQLRRFKNIVFSSFVSFIICGICYAICIFLYILKRNIDIVKDQRENTILLYLLSFGITIITSVMDFILEIVLKKLVKSEKPFTWTNFYTSYSIKLTFFTFINSALVPVLCELTLGKYDEFTFLINNMLIKFLVNAFVTPIMWTINFNFGLKKIRQCLIEKKDKINYNQKELNEIYLLQSMNIALKYSYIVKTLLMSFIYIPIFPLGLGISLLGLIFGYWLEKFNFSKMYSKSKQLDKQIAEVYMKFFIIIFWAYSLGDTYFLSDVYEKDTLYYAKFFLPFNFLILIPFHSLFQKDFLKFKESEIHQKTYDDKYADFNKDYERANPMTKIEGERRYLDKLGKKNKINKEEIDKKEKKITEDNPMKENPRIQRLCPTQKIKGLDKLLNLNNENKDKKNKNNKIKPIKLKNKNNEKEGLKKKRRNSTKKESTIVVNESGVSIQSNYLMKNITLFK